MGFLGCGTTTELQSFSLSLSCDRFGRLSTLEIDLFLGTSMGSISPCCSWTCTTTPLPDTDTSDVDEAEADEDEGEVITFARPECLLTSEPSPSARKSAALWGESRDSGLAEWERGWRRRSAWKREA